MLRAQLLLAYLCDNFAYRSILVTVGIFVIIGIDIGEYHQKRCVKIVCHMGREAVIVSKDKLFDTDGIVLIDDRHHTVFKQCIDRLFRMGSRPARIEHVGTQQYL